MGSRGILIQPQADEGGKSMARHAGKSIVSPVLPFSPFHSPSSFLSSLHPRVWFEFLPPSPFLLPPVTSYDPHLSRLTLTHTHDLILAHGDTHTHTHGHEALSSRDRCEETGGERYIRVGKSAPLYACGKSRFVIENLSVHVKNIHVIYTQFNFEIRYRHVRILGYHI